jgi:lipoprotein-anchoring transpeptidase ErfK/SrfK
MRELLSGWKPLAIAFLGLAGLGAGLLLTDTPGKVGRDTAGTAALPGREVTQKPAQTAQAAPETKPVDDRFVIKRILPINGPIKYGEWHWDDKNVPDGPIVVTVDLKARVISVFRNGYEIGASAVLLGSPEKPTPTGVFPITQKRRHHTSNLYDAPMPYMQRLTNDGISLHATEVEWGYASHGCIGMPEAFAAKVFGVTEVGDKVYITDGKTVGMGDALVES